TVCISLHIKAVKTKIFSQGSGFIILPHIGDKIRHLFGAVYFKTNGPGSFQSGSLSAVYITVYLLTASIVSFQGKSPYLIFFYQKFKYFQLQLLKFHVSVGSFPQTNDPGFFWYGNILYAACIRSKLFRICAFSCAETSNMHKN